MLGFARPYRWCIHAILQTLWSNALPSPLIICEEVVEVGREGTLLTGEGAVVMQTSQIAIGHAGE